MAKPQRGDLTGSLAQEVDAMVVPELAPKATPREQNATEAAIQSELDEREVERLRRERDEAREEAIRNSEEAESYLDEFQAATGTWQRREADLEAEKAALQTRYDALLKDHEALQQDYAKLQKETSPSALPRVPTPTPDEEAAHAAVADAIEGRGGWERERAGLTRALAESRGEAARLQGELEAQGSQHKEQLAGLQKEVKEAAEYTLFTYNSSIAAAESEKAPGATPVNGPEPSPSLGGATRDN